MDLAANLSIIGRFLGIGAFGPRLIDSPPVSWIGNVKIEQHGPKTAFALSTQFSPGPELCRKMIGEPHGPGRCGNLQDRSDAADVVTKKCSTTLRTDGSHFLR